MKLSVIVSVYDKEEPSHFDQCLESIDNQTVTPDEVLIVEDGFINSHLVSIIEKYQIRRPKLYKRISLKKNHGGGWKTYQIGVLKAKNELIARMDSDDISYPDRFEKQLAVFQRFPEYDIVGGWITEFAQNHKDPTKVRKVPETHESIAKLMTSRNPMNHVTVMYKKAKVVDAGNYPESRGFADYGLWIRLISSSAIFHNIQEPLVNVRIGNDMIGRRHGIKYLQNEISHFREMRTMGLVNNYEFFKEILPRTLLRISPKFVLRLAYQYFSGREKI